MPVVHVVVNSSSLSAGNGGDMLSTFGLRGAVSGTANGEHSWGVVPHFITLLHSSCIMFIPEQNVTHQEQGNEARL